MSTLATHVTIECRVTVGEREALAAMLDTLDGMVKHEVLSMKNIDRDAAKSGLAKLVERVKEAADW